MTNLRSLIGKHQRKLVGLSVLGLLISAPAQPLAAQVTPAQICDKRTFFGAPQGCSPSDVAKIFWVPPCGGTSPVTGRARIPSNPSDYSVSILYNRSPATRRLTLNGTASRDIVIGSPGSSDTINGGDDGDNAFMVGGGTSILSADGSSVTPDGSTEIDVLNLRAGAIDFVNIKPAGQSNPVSILVPQRVGGVLARDRSGRLLGTPMAVSGSGAITAASAPADVTRMTTTCSTAARPSNPSSQSIAMVPGLGQSNLPLGMGDSRFPILLAQPSEPVVEEEPITPSFPGVPVVQGFTLNGRDILVLSADDFPIDLNAYPDLNQSQWPAPLQPDSRRSSHSSRELTPARRYRIFKCGECDSLKPQISKQETPFLYNNKNGLLVFSRNKAPLGSKGNPGLVVAQLLDKSGLPLKLKGSGRLRPFPARFLIITPPRSNSTTDRPKPPSKQDMLLR
ncbi:MAG: hypothetical protein VKK97_01060 [Synechococcaceae cyanobacterium]|nr:hypothetical protein [Synechococcaceae cyanobacterium]